MRRRFGFSVMSATVARGGRHPGAAEHPVLCQQQRARPPLVGSFGVAMRPPCGTSAAMAPRIDAHREDQRLADGDNVQAPVAHLLIKEGWLVLVAAGIEIAGGQRRIGLDVSRNSMTRRFRPSRVAISFTFSSTWSADRRCRRCDRRYAVPTSGHGEDGAATAARVNRRRDNMTGKLHSAMRGAADQPIPEGLQPLHQENEAQDDGRHHFRHESL